METNVAEESLPRLNLTKNAIWDNPVLGDTCFENLESIILASPDSAYLRKFKQLDNQNLNYDLSIKVGKEIDKMPDSQYKGLLQLLCLNYSLVATPDSLLTIKRIHESIERGYQIAEGENKIPQSVFLAFWDNCILFYSHKQQTDSVSQEAKRFMKICRQQNIPLGIMQAHMGLAYCLMANYDYVGASENFEKVIEIADKYYPEILGPAWHKIKATESDYVITYYQALGLEARCRVDSRDTTWMKKYQSKLEFVVNTIDDPVITHNFFYALAIFYDKWGSKDRYESLMWKFKDCLTRAGSFRNDINDASSHSMLSMYYTILVRHELRALRGDAAMAYMQKMPEYFNDSTKRLYPEALLLQGKYKESSQRYKVTCDYYYSMMNGRNRSLMHSLSSNVTEENKQMQLLQTKIDSQKTHLIYNSLLLIIFNIMVIGLGYFLYRQHRLNEKLVEAVDMAEKANNAKSIFLKNVTHEINTPLNAIFGFSQILADPSMPKDEDFVGEMADGIVEGSEKLNNLLDNIVEATEKLTELDRLEDTESVLEKIHST